MSLLVFGTIGIDTVHTPGGQHRENILGGSCTYFAAAASFFTPVRLVAAVGEDFPDEFRAVLKQFEAIDLAGLEVRKGSKTFRWGGKYLDNMDHRESLFTELNVLEEAPPPIPEAYRDSALVFLANAHPGRQALVLDSTTKRRLVVADTMDLWINIAKDDLLALLKRVDGLVLNYDEAELLTGHRNTVAAGRHMLDLGPRFVVIKKGEHGCLLIHRDGIAALPAYPTERVVDPTGAGDTFAGGLMGRLAQLHAQDPKRELASFESVREGLVAGTIAASFNIEKFSLERLVEISADDIAQRAREFAAMLRVG
ncbi:MAG: PfkB family carbohydrate kinase [Phycisphaerales bacterium]